MKDFPKTIQIETTTICPSDCVMCPHRFVTRKKFMDMGLIEKIIDECIGKPVTIIPHQMGDPFADNRMMDILRKCKDAKLTTALSTTAFLLTEEKIRELMDIGIAQINISVDSFKKDIYESIRRNLDFDRVMANIVSILKHKNPATKVLLSAVDLGFNKGVKEDMKCFAKGKSIDGVQFESYVQYPDVKDKRLPRPKHKDRKYCYRLLTDMVIMSDGRVSKCCIDYNGTDILGDVNLQSMEDIWNGEKRKNLINDIEQNGRKAFPCDTCNLG